MDGDLRDRYAETMATAQWLCRRSVAALESARVRQEAAQEIRASVERYRQDRGAVAPRDRDDLAFEISGLVDGALSSARWGPSSGLVCSSELRDRVEVVVALGETFAGDGDGDAPGVVASLDAGPTAALLTVMRSFTRVTSVEMQGGAFGVSTVGADRG